MLSLIVLGLLSCVSAQKGCPDIPVKEHFDISKWVGVWYGFGTNSPDDVDFKCSKANFDAEGDYVSIKYTSVLISTGEESIRKGKATVPDRSVPAKMKCKFDNWPFESNYWIMDTDYVNYLVIFSCFSETETTRELVWILSREKTLVDEYKNKIVNLLEMNGIKPDSVITTVQDCQN